MWWGIGVMANSFIIIRNGESEDEGTIHIAGCGRHGAESAADDRHEV